MRRMKNYNRIEGIAPLSITAQQLVMEEKLAEHTINKGMFSDLDPIAIPEQGLSLAKNAVIRNDKTSRRPGSSLFHPSAPDTNRVLRVVDYVRKTGVTNLVRQTKNSIYYATTNVWVAVTGPALTGTDFDPISSVVVNDRYFSANGKDKIIEVNINTNTYAFLGNATVYKKLTGFYNRLIAANLQGGSPNPLQIGWSGDLNFGEWSSLVDPTAGFISLIDSSEDVTDTITDIFGFDAVLVILRQRSIWTAIKQPSGSDPFYFACSVPGQGCTCPNAAAKLPNGIVFPDLRTKSIYVYTTDGAIKDIGIAVRETLMASISDPEAVFGSYSPTSSEYSICIPNEFTNITQEWRYNFRTNAWSYNELAAVSSISDINNIAGSRSIDELQGTINALLGNINSLANPIAQLPRRIYGRFDGNISIETIGQITDTIYESGYGYHYSLDYGGTLYLIPPNFETRYESKSYNNPGNDIYISSCAFEFFCRTVGSFILSYSKDDGVTFTTQATYPIVFSQLYKPFYIELKKMFKCRRFMWALSTTDIDHDLLSETIRAYPLTAQATK